MLAPLALVVALVEVVLRRSGTVYKLGGPIAFTHGMAVHRHPRIRLEVIP